MKTWLAFVAISAIFLSSLFYVLFLLPPEASQGFVQKIFFIHVPSAFAMYVTLIMGAIFSGLYLKSRKESYDLLARAHISTALLFALVVMVSGPFWAKPIWGVYWTWDPRLTTTFIVFILLAGYAFLRAFFGKSSRGAITGAIIAILAVLDIPLIHFSVKLWRGIHPSVLNNPDGLPENYRLGLELMVLGIFGLAFLYVNLFYRLYKLEAEMERKLR